jgi:N-methylhydantoinase A/oxoprolinase/acetone carboxylase beta subunit
VTLDEALALMEEAYLGTVAAALRRARPAPDTVIAAFGGAGPMTMCGAARAAGVTRVIVPRTAAIFSAFGIGYSDISQRYEQPLPDGATVDEVVRELRERAGRDMYAEGVDLADCVQAWRLRVERDGTDSTVDLPDPAGASQYLREGRLRSGELASLELTVVAALPHVAADEVGEVADSAAVASGTRTVRQRDGSVAELPVIALVNQPPGAQIAGPAVIEGPSFTMRLPAGWQAQTTAAGDLLLTDHGSI